MRNTKEQVMEEVDDWEVIRGVGPDGTRGYTEAGDPYVTIAWSADGEYIKSEARRGEMFSTPELAWVLWFRAFMCYIDRNEGMLHWRMRPELIKRPAGTDTSDTMTPKYTTEDAYVVVARLFVEREPSS